MSRRLLYNLSLVRFKLLLWIHDLIGSQNPLLWLDETNLKTRLRFQEKRHLHSISNSYHFCYRRDVLFNADFQPSKLEQVYGIPTYGASQNKTIKYRFIMHYCHNQFIKSFLLQSIQWFEVTIFTESTPNAS